jgi:hypothetical protein
VVTQGWSQSRPRRARRERASGRATRRRRKFMYLDGRPPAPMGVRTVDLNIHAG